MRASDLAHLNQPYPKDHEPTEADARAAIGVKLPEWTSLESEILADFVEQEPYGIGWWAPYPGTSRRILIADQLYSCLTSVGQNMTEAALHWLEYLDAMERNGTRYADAVRMDSTGVPFDPPRPHSASEQLAPDLVRMHQAGLIRAIASSLDCLAGVIIGVSALPEDILKANFKSVRNALPRAEGATTLGVKAQADFAKQLERSIAAVGPEGWLDWALDLRDMLVHRRRRIELGQFRRITPVLLGANGKPVPRFRLVSHLPRDPSRSDIEVFIEKQWNAVLHEEGTRTLRGLMNSTSDLLEASAEHLFNLWRWRRDNPKDLPQPKRQWPKGLSRIPTNFDGYDPGSYPFDPSIGMLHPITARRFLAAAADDAARPQWATFD